MTYVDDGNVVGLGAAAIAGVVDEPANTDGLLFARVDIEVMFTSNDLPVGRRFSMHYFNRSQSLSATDCDIIKYCHRIPLEAVSSTKGSPSIQDLLVQPKITSAILASSD